MTRGQTEVEASERMSYEKRIQVEDRSRRRYSQGGEQIEREN
jgi:hypothetical protein